MGSDLGLLHIVKEQSDWSDFGNPHKNPQVSVVLLENSYIKFSFVNQRGRSEKLFVGFYSYCIDLEYQRKEAKELRFC